MITAIIAALALATLAPTDDEACACKEDVFASFPTDDCNCVGGIQNLIGGPDYCTDAPDCAPVWPTICWVEYSLTWTCPELPSWWEPHRIETPCDTATRRTHVCPEYAPGVLFPAEGANLRVLLSCAADCTLVRDH